MWEELGVLGGVPLIERNSLFTCEHDGKTITLYTDLERTESEMLESSPRDARQTRELMRAVRALQALMGISERGADFKSYLVAPILFKYYSMTTGQLAARFKSPLLQKFVISFFGESFGSLAVILVFAHFTAENGGIPEGGSAAMAERMTERFRSLGGELILGKSVVKLLFDGSRAEAVLLDSEERITGDYFVLATEPHAAFGKLLDLPLPRRLASELANKRLMRFSSFHCAFACSTDNIPFEEDRIIEVPEEYRRILGSSTLFIREFSSEPSYAPEGKCVIQALIFCDEESAGEFIRLRAEDRYEYRRLKDKLSLTCEYLIGERFPELRGKIKIIDSWTPATYHRYTGSVTGSYMAYVLPEKYLPRRISPKVEGTENLFIATQWQSLPGGLPNAAYAGKRAADTIAEAERRRARKVYGNHRLKVAHQRS